MKDVSVAQKMPNDLLLSHAELQSLNSQLLGTKTVFTSVFVPWSLVPVVLVLQ